MPSQGAGTVFQRPPGALLVSAGVPPLDLERLAAACRVEGAGLGQRPDPRRGRHVWTHATDTGAGGQPALMSNSMVGGRREG